MESLSDQWPAHGASRQRQAALFVPCQTPAEAPQLPGQCQQQDRGEKRSERGGQGRQHSKLRQGQHLLRAGPLPSIHLRLRAEIVWAVRKKLLPVRLSGILFLFLLGSFFFSLVSCKSCPDKNVRSGCVYPPLPQKLLIQLISGESQYKLLLQPVRPKQ